MAAKKTAKARAVELLMGGKPMSFGMSTVKDVGGRNRQYKLYANKRPGNVLSVFKNMSSDRIAPKSSRTEIEDEAIKSLLARGGAAAGTAVVANEVKKNKEKKANLASNNPSTSGKPVKPSQPKGMLPQSMKPGRPPKLDTTPAPGQSQLETGSRVQSLANAPS